MLCARALYEGHSGAKFRPAGFAERLLEKIPNAERCLWLGYEIHTHQLSPSFSDVAANVVAMLACPSCSCTLPIPDCGFRTPSYPESYPMQGLAVLGLCWTTGYRNPVKSRVNARLSGLLLAGAPIPPRRGRPTICRTAGASKLDAQKLVSPTNHKPADQTRQRRIGEQIGEMGQAHRCIPESKLDALRACRRTALAARELILFTCGSVCFRLGSCRFNEPLCGDALPIASLQWHGQPWRGSRPGSMAPIRSCLAARDRHA